MSYQSKEYDGAITINKGIAKKAYSALPPDPETAMKTVCGVNYADVAKIGGVAIASVKTWNGLA